LFNAGSISEASLVLDVVNTPFKNTKVYVKIYVDSDYSKENEIENIRKSFTRIPWCVSSRILKIAGENYMALTDY